MKIELSPFACLAVLYVCIAAVLITVVIVVNRPKQIVVQQNSETAKPVPVTRALE